MTLTWTLLQIFFDMMLALGVVVLWLRLRRPPQDDPRLSRGLQLLQSKITVLEDLSDRTDHQVKQLSALLDHKTRQIQEKILEADRQGLKIEESMNKSLEVAEIFQDKIPHHEIVERQRTIEYVKAARMAHGGAELEDILSSVNLPREQVELIAKFNKDQLMFNEEALPAWAKKEDALNTSLPNLDFLSSLDSAPRDFSNLQSLGEDFKKSLKDFADRENTTVSAPAAAEDAAPVDKPVDSASSVDTANSTKNKILSAAQEISNGLLHSAAGLLDIQDTDMIQAAKSKPPAVRKVEFPRIQTPPKI